MTAVILWKEYRQQRAFWLAIALLAGLLVVGLSSTMAQGSGMQVFTEERVRDALTLVVLCLTISYGVVCGALLLAGENDDGTLIFLDSLSGWRGPVWARKCLAGVVLTLSMSLALGALAVGLGFAPWPVAVILPWLGLDALAWGMLGGAVCRKVLPAVLLAIACLGLSWVVLALCENGAVLGMGKTLAALAAVCGSWRIFCRLDRERRQHLGHVSATVIDGWDGFPELPSKARPMKKSGPAVPARTQRPTGSLFSSIRVLLWLAVRQGRWVLVACLAWTMLFAFNVHREPLILWPFATMLLGLICGLAVFTFDQQEGQRFLGAQRLPPGTIWTVKILFWGTVLFGLTLLARYLDMAGGVLFYPSDRIHQEVRGNRWFDELGPRAALVSAPVFLGLWPLYGFCYGQFFGQLVRRPILAVIMAFTVGPSVVAVWIPSLLFGGVPTWQMLIPPVVLLLVTRLIQWPWMSDRLLTLRPLAVIGSGSTLIAVAVAGCLWYRTVEVPELNEPFDVAAFTASLPPPEKNEAGRLLRRASAEMQQQRNVAEQQVPSPHESLFPRASEPKQPNGGQPMPLDQLEGPAPPFGGWNWRSHQEEVLSIGWPQQDKELGSWLDQLFGGRWFYEAIWVKDAQQAARLPLSVLENPRLPQPKERWWNTIQDCEDMARYFVLRGLQQQAHGNPRAALDHFDTVLALSRQVKHDAPLAYLYCGDNMETIALVGLRFWLRKVGPDRELLRKALKMLQRHHGDLPDPVDSIKAQYLVDSQEVPTFVRHSDFLKDLLATAAQVPWEKERQLRLAHAVLRAGVALQFQEAQQPQPAIRGPMPFPSDNADKQMRWAQLFGLPPKDGPGSRLTAQQWGALIEQFQLNRGLDYAPASVLWGSTVRNQTGLHSTVLVIAVAFYQAEHGKPPDTLDALVPGGYLTALPDDPWTGQPFRYRISPGEKIDSQTPPFTLAPGQAVIFTEHWGRLGYFPVPVWTK